jgi:hypothetical protein
LGPVEWPWIWTCRPGRAGSAIQTTAPILRRGPAAHSPDHYQVGAGRRPSLWEFVFEIGVLSFARSRLTSTFAEEMKTLLLSIFVAQISAAFCHAEDAQFRFNRAVGVSGLACEVSDGEGKRTTIKFSDESNTKAKFLLDSLLSNEGVWGALSPEVDPRGITWDQGIILIGKFSSEEKITPYIENGAAQEPYREFKLSGIQVQMPFAQWIQTDKEDPISSPYVVIYHLSLESLFPKGLSYEGVPLELRGYETKSKSEQGAAGQPATRPESK